METIYVSQNTDNKGLLYDDAKIKALKPPKM